MPTLNQSFTLYSKEEWLIYIDKDGYKFNFQNKKPVTTERAWNTFKEEMEFYGHELTDSMQQLLKDLIKIQ